MFIGNHWNLFFRALLVAHGWQRADMGKDGKAGKKRPGRRFRVSRTSKSFRQSWKLLRKPADRLAKLFLRTK